MFNLKDKTRLEQVQIIGDDSRSNISNSDHAVWGIDLEESAQHQAKAKNQKKAATGNQFRVRIYNVY
jgi:hypothetical protein